MPRDTEKFPDEEIRVPKYTVSVFLYNTNNLTICSSILVILRLIFIIHEVQSNLHARPPPVGAHLP